MGGPDVAPQRGVSVGEWVRYAVVCGVLLHVAPPAGVAVAFFWGLSLIRRLRARAQDGWQPAPPAEDHEPAQLPREVRPQLVPVRLAELLERECSARAARMAARGVALSREVDADGSLRGDPELLGIAVGDLLDAALAELEPRREARLAAELGENLAGSEVWLRLRGAAGEAAPTRGEEPGPLELRGLGPVRRIARAHGGSLEALAERSGFELLLTLPKPAPTSDRP